MVGPRHPEDFLDPLDVELLPGLGFGYSGRPASGHHDLFRVIGTSLNYDWTKSLALGVYYGHLFGGSVVRSIFKNDDADFGFVEATVRL